MFMEIRAHSTLLVMIVIISFISAVRPVAPKIDTNAIDANSRGFQIIKLLSETSDIKSEQIHEHKGLHLIGWEWNKNKNSWLFCLLLVMAALTKIAYHFSHFLSNVIPESCILILLGLTIGAAIHSLKLSEEVPRFTTELFFFVLLPPIILESAYSLHDIVFVTNLGSILVFAVIGTIINIALIGPSLYLVKLIPWKWLAFPEVSFLELMVFGTAISAVDPVSVLAIFQDLSVNKSLYFLVFGESLLNDAVVIVVHRILSSMLGQTDVRAIEFLKGIFALFLVSFGGFFIGVLFGVLTSLLTLKTTHVRVIEPMIVVTMAYMGFLSAEMVHFSGLISLIGCGIVQSEYTFKNISHKSRTTVTYFAKTFSTISDLLIFFFLGTMLFNDQLEWNTTFALLSLLFCLVYRFISVFALTFILNNLMQRVPAIKFEEQILMAYGGLRGAVAFALIAVLHDYNIQSFTLLRTTTLFIILCTVFVLGSTTKPLLSLLRIRREVKEEAKLFHVINSKFIQDLVYGISDITGVHTFNHFWTQKLIKLNEKYFKKYLTHGNNRDHIESVLQKVIFEEEMEKLFGVDVDSEEESSAKKDISDDKNNNDSKVMSISNSRIDVESGDNSDEEESSVCHRFKDKFSNTFSRLRKLKIFSRVKKRQDSEVDIQRRKTRKMSVLLQKAFDESDINQTILRNSVTKAQIAEREKIKKSRARERRPSKLSTDVRIPSAVNRPMDSLKPSDQTANSSDAETNEPKTRRLSIISNISNIDINEVQTETNK